MTDAQPTSQHAPVVVLLLAGMVALTVVAPLAVPTALAAGLAWYVAGGRARWLLLAGLTATGAAVVMAGPAAILSGWHGWQGFDPEHLPVSFVTRFGPVGPAA